MKKRICLVLAALCVVGVCGEDRESMIQNVQKILEKTFDEKQDLSPASEARTLITMLFDVEAFSPTARCELLRIYEKDQEEFVKRMRAGTVLTGSKRSQKAFYKSMHK